MSPIPTSDEILGNRRLGNAFTLTLKAIAGDLAAQRIVDRSAEIGFPLVNPFGPGTTANCQSVSIAVDARLNGGKIQAPRRFPTDLGKPSEAKGTEGVLGFTSPPLDDLTSWLYGASWESVSAYDVPAYLAANGGGTALLSGLYQDGVLAGHQLNVESDRFGCTIWDGQVTEARPYEPYLIPVDEVGKTSVLITTMQFLDVDRDALAKEGLEIMMSKEFNLGPSPWGQEARQLQDAQTFRHLQTFTDESFKKLLMQGAAGFVEETLDVPNRPPCPEAVVQALRQFESKGFPGLSNLRQQQVAAKTIRDTIAEISAVVDVDFSGIIQTVMKRSACSVQTIMQRAQEQSVKITPAEALRRTAAKLGPKGILVVVEPGTDRAQHIRKIDGYLVTFDADSGKMYPGAPLNVSGNCVMVETGIPQGLLTEAGTLSTALVQKASLGI